jgi:hypothetical protein
MSDTFSKVEVITGVARRRRFSTDVKLAVVAETIAGWRITTPFTRISGWAIAHPGSTSCPNPSRVRSNGVNSKVAAWQARPLEATYPLVFFDALRVKFRDEGLVRYKAVHIALGVRADGAKEILGLWLEQDEGAKFWLRVMNELKNRGVKDVLVAVVDGLKGFPDAITAVFPQATVQTCCATAWTSFPGRTANPWRRR